MTSSGRYMYAQPLYMPGNQNDGHNDMPGAQGDFWWMRIYLVDLGIYICPAFVYAIKMMVTTIFPEPKVTFDGQDDDIFSQSRHIYMPAFVYAERSKQWS